MLWFTLRKMTSPDPNKRAAAAGELGESDSPRAVAALLAMRLDTSHPADWGVEQAIKAALETLADRHPDLLLPWLKTVNPSTRAVVVALGKAGTTSALPDLARLASHEDYWLRQDVFKALDQIDPKWPAAKSVRDTFDSFLAALKHGSDARLRGDVADVLGRMGIARAKTDLLAALEADDSYLKAMAARALGRLRITEAVEPLIRALQSGEGYVRKCAAVSLGQLADKRAIEPLRAALSGPASEEAGEALDKLGANRALDELLAKLRQVPAGSKESREYGKALRKAGAPAVPALIQMLGDEQPAARAAAAYALGVGGDPPAAAAAALAKALLDHDKDVRERANETIQNYCGKSAQAVADPIIKAWTTRGFVSLQTLERMQLCDWRVIDLLLRNFVPHPIPLLVDMPVPGLNPDIAKLSEFLLSLVPMSALTPEIVKWTCHVPVFRRELRSLSLETSDEAVRNLCSIRNPVTSNVLHLVLEKQDFHETFYVTDDSSSWTSLISFEHQREAARQELANRGNPPYDPDHYRKK